MATELKLRKGTTAEHSTFTGAEAEVTVDTDKETVVVHDGVTAGGSALAREDMSNVSDPSFNSIEVGNLTTTQSGSTSAIFKSVRAQKSNFDTETNVDCFQFDFAGSGSGSSDYGSISGTLHISQQGSTTGGTVREGFCAVNFIIERNAFRTANLTLSSTDIIGTMSPTISLSSATNTQAVLSLNLNAGNNREGHATAVIEAAAVGNSGDDILTVTAL